MFQSSYRYALQILVVGHIFHTSRISKLDTHSPSASFQQNNMYICIHTHICLHGIGTPQCLPLWRLGDIPTGSLDLFAGFSLCLSALSVFAQGLVGVQFRYAFGVAFRVAILDIGFDLTPPTDCCGGNTPAARTIAKRRLVSSLVLCCFFNREKHRTAMSRCLFLPGRWRTRPCPGRWPQPPVRMPGRPQKLRRSRT